MTGNISNNPDNLQRTPIQSIEKPHRKNLPPDSKATKAAETIQKPPNDPSKKISATPPPINSETEKATEIGRGLYPEPSKAIQTDIEKLKRLIAELDLAYLTALEEKGGLEGIAKRAKELRNKTERVDLSAKQKMPQDPSPQVERVLAELQRQDLDLGG